MLASIRIRATNYRYICSLMYVHISIDRHIPWGMLKQTSPATSSVVAAEMRVESVWEGGSSCGEREKASQLFTVAMVDYLKEQRFICP